jgi:AraC family transcriptional regulator
VRARTDFTDTQYLKDIPRDDTAECHRRAVTRVISTIRAEFDQSFSLRRMAAVAFMSPYHFNRVFRSITGLPPRQFLAAVRAEAAAKLLITTQNRVTDVCLDVGYNSLGTFVRRFTAMFGVPPNRLRKMCLNEFRPCTADKSMLATKADSVKVTVEIKAPSWFLGPIFLGLFHNSFPAGEPVATAIAERPGFHELWCTKRGSFFLFALGLSSANRVEDYLICSKALRSLSVLVDVGSWHMAVSELELREPVPTDPPVLLNLPMIFQTRDRQHHSPSSSMATRVEGDKEALPWGQRVRSRKPNVDSRTNHWPASQVPRKLQTEQAIIRTKESGYDRRAGAERPVDFRGCGTLPLHPKL